MHDECGEFSALCGVTNQELIKRVRHLVRADQSVTARLLLHLGEVEARGLYRDQAYSSMFAYCVEELGMFEHQAFLRLQAARLGRRFPRVLELVAEGALHSSGIKLLAPHLTADNHAQLLERVSGKSKREIEALVAAIAPKPDVPSRMRKLPDRSQRRTQLDEQRTPTAVETRQASLAPEALARSPIDASAVSVVDQRGTPTAQPSVCDTSREPSANTPTATRPQHAGDVVFGDASAANRSPLLDNPSSTQCLTASGAAIGDVSAAYRAPSLDGGSTRTLSASAAPFALEAPRPRGSSKPLSPGRYKVEFTAGQALHDKLAQLQELLRHQVPDGDLAVIVERAADLLIENTMKKRFAQTCAAKKPRTANPRKANSRYIPRAVVRAVHQRDNGQCTFVSAEGKRCGARGLLELHHHDRPYGRGGRATVANLRLVCRAHNALFAERDYGRAFMVGKRKQTREPSEELVPELKDPRVFRLVERC